MLHEELHLLLKLFVLFPPFWKGLLYVRVIVLNHCRDHGVTVLYLCKVCCAEALVF